PAGTEVARANSTAGEKRRGGARLARPLVKFRARWQKTPRFIRVMLAGLVLLVALRLTLPMAVAAYVNRQLNKSPDYSGQIREVKLRVWHGSYHIHDIRIF